MSASLHRADTLAPSRGLLLPLLAPMAGLLLRPWFDALALPGIVRWYFPLSRAWAAAEIAADDLERFRAEVDCPIPLRRIAGMPTVTARGQRYRAAAEAWEATFFAATAPSPDALAAAERARVATAHAWMTTRGVFLPLHMRVGVPSLKWQPAVEAEVERRHGPRLADPERAFAVGDGAVTRSHVLTGPYGNTSWLRFPSRVGGEPDLAWARVIEPPDIADPPTLIFLHGVGVETEFWTADLGRVDALVQSGIRIIRPEAPWHGRRRKAGWFGGEPVMAQGPLGMLDLFAAWVGEVGRLVAWARTTSAGPVAIGGVSLGALTSQMAASVAGAWPAAMRPDALFLVGTTDNVVEAAISGGLARALGAGKRLAALSWSPSAIARWAPLLQPQLPPVMAPEAIVMVIGTSDVVTPFDGGIALARRWRLPPENLFQRPQGHFSVALGLEHDAAPLERLAQILRRQSGRQGLSSAAAVG